MMFDVLFHLLLMTFVTWVTGTALGPVQLLAWAGGVVLGTGLWHLTRSFLP